MALQLESSSDFQLQLDNFEGPFDLLLTLISKHELDVTEISLSKVTDEFLIYVRGVEKLLGLDRASEFLVVAATLIDYKLASLLPSGELVDAEDVRALEARDLLFARLLQYKAFKEASAWLSHRLASESSRFQRMASLESKYKDIKPPLRFNTDAQSLAKLAEQLLSFDPAPKVDHLHADKVSVKDQAERIALRLRNGPKSFLELVVDQPKPVIVASFLAVLELYRQNAVKLSQEDGQPMIVELIEIPAISEQIGDEYE